MFSRRSPFRDTTSAKMLMSAGTTEAAIVDALALEAAGAIIIDEVAVHDLKSKV
jgi:hypothetical protein